MALGWEWNLKEGKEEVIETKTEKKKKMEMEKEPSLVSNWGGF